MTDHKRAEDLASQFIEWAGHKPNPRDVEIIANVLERYASECVEAALSKITEERCAHCGEVATNYVHRPASQCPNCKAPQDHHEYVPGDRWFLEHSIARAKYLRGEEEKP